jgi:diguanylate cyclase (GGDEF)-like protein
MALEQSQTGWGKFTMPAIVLTAGTVLSLGLGYVAHREIMRSAQQRFDSLALDVARKVEDRFHAYTAVLIGLRARFNTPEAVTRQQFKLYVADLSLSTEFPGLQVLNYATYVPAAEKHGFEERLRNDKDLAPAVAKEFSVTPPGERSEYHPITFIEPLIGNEQALGKDMGALPEALKALQQARDSGRLTSSGRKIHIKEREADLGLALRLPVYRANWLQDTVETRRAAYLGSVGAGFRLADMMRDVTAGNAAALRLRLFDGGSTQGDVRAHVQDDPMAAPLVTEGALLFDSAKGDTAIAAQANNFGTAHGVFRRTLAFQFAGRAWVVQVSEGAASVVGRPERAAPWLLLLCGLAVSGLLSGIVFSLTTSRSRAQAIALAMTHHLRVGERQLEEAQHVALRDDMQRRKGDLRLRLEYEVAQLLLNDGEPAHVISRALEAVCRHLRWDYGSVWGIGKDGIARCGASWHAGNDVAIEQFVGISRSLEYGRDEGSLGRAWASDEALHIDTLSAQRDFTRDALASQAGLAAGLIVPMKAAGSIAALEFFSRAPHAIDADLTDSVRAIALQIAQYMQRKRAETELRHMASHDALTGLANRSALQLGLARAIKRSNRHQKRFAVMFVDFDGFKRFNDTLGHGVGDAMIKACGERLAGVLREDDTAARFGGDEFVLVLENLTKASDAAVVAEKVLSCCAEPLVIDGRELRVTACIGVSIYPEDGADGETLVKNADTAMYRAKDKGHGSCQFYAAQMNAQGAERLVLEDGLRRAIERGELELHYQPKMDLHTQRIVGVEALMRWRHPTLGLVSPAQFISIAEDTGLIVPLGKWALQTACAVARDWQQRGLPPLQMSVNLSPRQLTSPTLIADISEVLATSGLDPTLLELEITEGAMMKSPEQAAALLQEIRGMGIGLAIDDFGTGYSSLSYLTRFPLSTVKIDRSFVHDLSTHPDAQALIQGIITLAHGLRMKVVAEGVETAEQLAYLRSHGCDQIQGYWLCKPMPAQDALTFMTLHPRSLLAAPVVA